MSEFVEACQTNNLKLLKQQINKIIDHKSWISGIKAAYQKIITNMPRNTIPHMWRNMIDACGAEDKKMVKFLLKQGISMKSIASYRSSIGQYIIEIGFRKFAGYPKWSVSIKSNLLIKDLKRELNQYVNFS